MPAATASKPEGNSGTTAFTFTLTRSGDTSATSSVIWSVLGSGIHPANEADFEGAQMPSDSVEFAADETAKTVTVLVTGDTTAEFDEGFTVALFDPVGATIAVASAPVTIATDDTTLSIAATSASKPEGTGDSIPFNFTVSRSGDLSTPHSAS